MIMTITLKVYITMTLPESVCSKLLALMQNEVYPDESVDENAHRRRIFDQLKIGKVHPAGRVREQTTTFMMLEGDAIWLADLVDNPIYEDESEDESAFRKVIKEEFWMPNLEEIQLAMRFWDHLPF